MMNLVVKEIFKNFWIFTVFKNRNSLTFSLASHNIKSSSDGKYELKIIEVSHSKMRSCWLFEDFFSQSYNSLKYWQFFIVGSTIMLFTCILVLSLFATDTIVKHVNI